MAVHQDRAPRLNLSFPLRFQEGNTVTLGHCLNLSESGLLGVFDGPLDLWTEGELLLQFGEASCHLPARVARSMDREAGLAFLFRSDADRCAVQVILEQAAAKSHLVGRAPF